MKQATCAASDRDRCGGFRVLRPNGTSFRLWWAAFVLACAPALPAAEPVVAPVPASPELVVDWPQDGQNEETLFDGNRFVPFARPLVEGTGPFTVSVWVNADDLLGGQQTYGRGIARSTRGEKTGDWVLSVDPAGRVRFCNWRSDGNDADGCHLTRDAHIEPEAWYHIVAAWDRKTSRIFVNGVLAEHRNVATDSGWGTGHEIGRGWTPRDYFWVGEIARLQVYRRALTEAEIAASFKADVYSKNLEPDSVDVKPTGDPNVSQALDEQILAKLHENNIHPVQAADDAEFLRRITLDLVGRIPTVAETESFLADTSPDKRAQRIDALLSGREMPYYWSHVLSNWLMPVEGRRDGSFVAYLRRSLAAGKPIDQLVREMLLARPSGAGDRPAGAFLNYRKARIEDHTVAKEIGSALFGVNLRCAQCHDHPEIPEWTRERFFGLSAFFVRSFEHTYTDGSGRQVTVLGEKATGELEYSATGGERTVARPTFLDGRVIEEPPTEKPAAKAVPSKTAPPPLPPFSRREALAELALDPQSPYFKRAFVNRVWRELMGRGLVEPIDMLHEDNPGTHPALLDLLADDFAGHGFDLRRLIGVIAHSRTYARSSRWEGERLPEETLYAVAVLKPMNVDQFALSLPLAAGVFDKRLGHRLQRPLTRVRPLTPDTDLLAAFNPRTERFEPTAEQALFLLNGSQMQQRFGDDSPLARRLAAAADDSELARIAYLAVLSREPAPVEERRVADYLAARGGDSRLSACGELAWALLTGAEFRFNH